MMYFTKEHEWVKVVEGNKVRIGITDHAQGQLGDIVFIEFTADFGDIEAGKEVVTVESVKSVSDVYAPVAGTITAQNETLNDTPETVNDSPLEEGWMFEMEINNQADLTDLLNEEAYQAFLAEEE